MIFDIIKKLNKELQITVLAVSSDVKGAIKYFEEFVVIDDLDTLARVKKVHF